jgi:hypothetical protein
MKRRRRSTLELLCVAITLLTLLVAAPVHAQRIVLLKPKTADPRLVQAFARLKGELMSHDFEVIVLDAADAEPSPRGLATAAERARAVATISLVRAEGLASADVWISDRVTGKTSMRTIATSDDRESSSVLAVRAVDLLRTSLREFPTGEKPPPEVVGATPERAPAHVRDWASGTPARSRWFLDAGGVVQTTLSRLGSAFGPSIALGATPTDRVGVAVVFQGPLSGARASTDGASLSLENEQLFAELRYRFILRPAWSVEATGALGAHRVAVEGAASPPYAGRSDTAWTALGAAGLGFELRITGTAAVLVNGRAVLLAPRPVLHLADTDLPYGRPALHAGVGLRVRF